MSDQLFDGVRRYGIVILPDVETCLMALSINRQLWPLSDASSITLGLTEEMRRGVLDMPSARNVAGSEGLLIESPLPGTRPHISLLHRAFRAHHLEHVITTLRGAVASLNMREVVGGFTGYQAWNQFIFRMVAPNPRLTKLHLTVANALASIDGDCKIPVEGELDDLSLQEWNRYGWLYAGRNYKPHLTVGYVREGDVTEAVGLLPGAKRDPALRDMYSGYWWSRQIGFGRLGPHGTVDGLEAIISFDGCLVR